MSLWLYWSDCSFFLTGDIDVEWNCLDTLVPHPWLRLMSFHDRVPTPASQVICTVVGRAGSGHEATCETGVRSVQGRGSNSVETLLNGYSCPTGKVAAKVAAKVTKSQVSFAASFMVSFHVSF